MPDKLHLAHSSTSNGVIMCPEFGACRLCLATSLLTGDIIASNAITWIFAVACNKKNSFSIIAKISKTYDSMLQMTELVKCNISGIMIVFHWC